MIYFREQHLDSQIHRVRVSETSCRDDLAAVTPNIPPDHLLLPGLDVNRSTDCDSR